MPWIKITEEQPPQDMSVCTKIDNAQGSRNVQHLRMRGKLWWLPDGSMYVYYTPTHWFKP